MSWETLVVGNFAFMGEVSEGDKSRVLEELEEVLEAKIEWDEEFEVYKFQDVNWMSHINSEEISVVVKKNKHLLDCFDCSIYDLSEPDEEVSMRDNGRYLEVKQRE